MTAGRREPPSWSRGLVDAAPVVIATSRDAFREVLDDPPPWSEGHLTAIAWVTDRGAERLLLVRHRLHGWSCPGGHVEPGESPAQTATRELLEETAIVATAARQPLTLGSSLGCARAPGARHWTIGFRFTVASDSPLRGESGQPVGWFPLDRLPRPRAADLDEVAAHLRPRPTP